MIKPGRGGRLGLVLGLMVVLGLAAVAIRGWYQAELSRIERELKSARVDSARARIERLHRLGLGGVETDYWQAACDEAQGRIDSALEIWGRIPPDSSRYANAILRRSRLAMDQGRLATALETLERVRFPRGSPAQDLHRIMLRQIELFTGQTDHLKRAIETDFNRASDPADLLRQHWLLDETRSYAVGALRTRLDKDHASAPEDDRVWLGLASLALHTARFDEADTWLRKCLARRPDDPLVWQARLDWAVATDRVPEAVEAMKHLPAASLEIEQILNLRAWLAARLADRAAEERALRRLAAYTPGDTKVLARLTELAVRAGRGDEVIRVRARKAELDQATETYRKILNAGVPTGGFDELGRLAETLGRFFEARGWWGLAAGQNRMGAQAREALARIKSTQAALAKVDADLAGDDLVAGFTSGSLADVLKDLVARVDSRRDRSRDLAAVPVFRDDATSAGLVFTYDNDPTPLRRMPETMGGGVGLIDYDGDGWLDVYAVGGGSLSNDSRPKTTNQRDRLFRNRGDGTFEDTTARSGLSAFPGGYGHGVSVGDYDNDGRPDLFVARWRSYALYRNRGDGTFEDATAKAGLDGDRDWPTSSALADLDGDGDLDLYVCHYSAWDPQTSPPCPHPSKSGENSYCGPRVFDATPDHLFRNDGGRFTDVSEESGVRAADREGRGLGVVAADLDQDGRVDLFVANDLTANYLFRNQGNLKFKETAWESGLAANAEGGYLAGMGVACGDLNGDGLIDLAVTNFYGESTTYYQNLGSGQFIDRTTAIGLAAPTRYLLGFGTSFFDADNDGRLDLATANGHVNDLSPNVPYAMPAQLLLGRPGPRLVDVTGRAGDCWSTPRLGRGLAVGDLDNDGRLDLMIVSEGTPLAYFHNQGPVGHAITFKLEGASPASNRDAVGARVIVTAGGHGQTAVRFGGGSFLSSCDDRLHFGLGEALAVETVEIHWPSGRVDHHKDLKADSAYRLREGQSPVAMPLSRGRGSAQLPVGPEMIKAEVSSRLAR